MTAIQMFSIDDMNPQNGLYAIEEPYEWEDGEVVEERLRAAKAAREAED